MKVEQRLHVMGCDAHLFAAGGEPGLLNAAGKRLQDLEQKWSRFLPSSEVSRLNSRPQEEIAVSGDTVLLFSAAVEAYRLTQGLFDPTVLASLLAKGYTLSRDGSGRECRIAGQAASGASPGCDHIEIDPALNTVRLPEGLAFDPGGIGKGLAADIVTEEMIQAGAGGALVNLGGDLRVRGAAPEGNAWGVAIEDPFSPDRIIATIRMGEGAIASSSIRTTTWVHQGVTEHHLIDPRTGGAPTSGVVAASVVAGSGWMAEAFSKVAMVSVTPAVALQLIESAGLAGLIVKSDGTLEIGANLGVFL